MILCCNHIPFLYPQLSRKYSLLGYYSIIMCFPLQTCSAKAALGFGYSYTIYVSLWSNRVSDLEASMCVIPSRCPYIPFPTLFRQVPSFHYLLMKTDTHYQPLLSDVPSDDHIPKDNGDFEEAVACSSPQCRPILLWTGLVLQSLVIIVVSSVALACSKSSCPINPVFPQVLYCRFFAQPSFGILLSLRLLAPAQEVLEYQPKTFLMGIGSRKSIYQQQPSDAVDQAWLDLYNRILSALIQSFVISCSPSSRFIPNSQIPSSTSSEQDPAHSGRWGKVRRWPRSFSPTSLLGLLNPAFVMTLNYILLRMWYVKVYPQSITGTLSQEKLLESHRKIGQNILATA